MSAKAALLILDGWGIGQIPASDAIARAKTPFFDHLWAKYPKNTLVTYGMDVGLPEGQMGNSEVGHLNIGAGRIVYQQLARINKAVEDGELAKNEVLISQVKKAVASDQTIHLFGLLSDGGVHSHINHLKTLILILEDLSAKKILIHAFLDGRDTSPTGGKEYLKDLEHFLKGKHTKIATVVGRYYAMDRDQRWERIKIAYDLLVNGKGTPCNDLITTIGESYKEGITDEFIMPIACLDNEAELIGTMKDGDLLFCFNFRTDRPREISKVLTQVDMPEHGMKKLNVDYLTMTRYDEKFTGIKVLFENDDLINTVGEVVSDAGKSQVRIAETEKYPHVTFFFSGGREVPFKLEERILISSPKVATYDLQPEMSAYLVTEALMAHVQKQKPDFVCLNFANADMVGHTGDFGAAMKAAEAVDSCLSRLVPILLSYDYKIIVIADHGNADYMINDDGTPNTAHTKNPVPCIYVSNQDLDIHLKKGKLADIAPTLLSLMDIKAPKEMTGNILIERA
ncbi:MAG: 2,3-bisphosphoglycerate-independent phosphoglycerate mutase [Saprospiraceae bacterium]|nr:2,3-bisphosphoglycerate-independent phosphoglycerate mutase [Saprospiraceae bacterium]